MVKVTVCFYVKHPRVSGIDVSRSQWGKPGWWNCAWVGSDSVGIRSGILSLAWFYGKFMTISENKIRWSLRWSRCWPWPLKVVVTSWKRAVPCRNLAGGKKRLRCSPEAEAFASLISVAARGHSWSFCFPYISGSSGAQDAEFHTAPNWKIHKAEIHQMNFMLNNSEFHRIPVAFISSSTTIIAPAVGFAMLGLSFLGSHPRYLLCNVPFWFHVVVNITMFGGSNPRTWLKAKYVSSMDMMLWKSKTIGWHSQRPQP